MRAHEAKRGLASGTGRDQIREVDATLMSSAAITLPPPTGWHPNWWAMLSRGDATRPITVEAAKYIIETVAVDVLGAQRASGVKIDLDGGNTHPARCLGRPGEPVRPFRLGGTGTARRRMSIRVTLEDGTPLDNRSKIKVTLPPPAPLAPEPIPERIARFWYSEERARPPWRYTESPEEQSAREQAERDGCWTGL